MTKRIADRTKINAIIADIMRRPLEYGTHDCALGLAGPVIEAQTGIDMAAPYRGYYHTLPEGAALLMADGFSNLSEYIGSKFAERPVGQAQVGDVAEVPSDHPGWALGVVLGERIAVLTETGFATLPRSSALKAFAIE